MNSILNISTCSKLSSEKIVFNGYEFDRERSRSKYINNPAKKISRNETTDFICNIDVIHKNNYPRTIIKDCEYYLVISDYRIISKQTKLKFAGKQGKDGPEEKKDADGELWGNVEAQAAFLGPNLWDKTLPYDADLKVLNHVCIKARYGKPIIWLSLIPKFHKVKSGTETNHMSYVLSFEYYYLFVDVIYALCVIFSLLIAIIMWHVIAYILFNVICTGLSLK